MEIGVDIFHESFLALRAHDEHVVFVDLAVQLLLGVQRCLMEYACQALALPVLCELRDGSVERGSNLHCHFVLERSFFKRMSASVAANPGHDIDRPSS